MLPELPDRNQVPNAKDFKVARGKDWLLQVPGKWAYLEHPETKAAFARWSESQKYETLCLLYVALTRAKRGLYAFLPEEPAARREKPAGESHATPANLVRQSTGIDFPESDPRWTDGVESLEVPEPKVLPKLPEGMAQRSRTNPSTGKKQFGTGGGSGRRIGVEVHSLFEEIEWLEPGEIPSLPYSAAGKIVEDSLKVPEIHKVFEDCGAELYREQGFELIHQGKWMSGVVDRLHVYRDGDEMTKLEVIDFKTDGVKSGGELVERYAAQMMNYQGALAAVFGVEPSLVKCRLLSTHLGEVVEVDEVNTQGELDL